MNKFLKRFFLVSIILIALFSIVFIKYASDEEYSSDYVTVAFYNVENLFDTINDDGINDGEFTPNSKKKWNEERYTSKLNSLARVIDKLGDSNGPEILGLSEIENRGVLVDLIKKTELKNKNYEIEHFESPDRRGIDVALLYKKNVFEVTNSIAIPVKMPSDSNFVSRDILHVTGRFADYDEFHFFVNHWPSRRGGLAKSEPKRTAAALTLRTAVSSLLTSDPNAKIIIMGDFNDEPENNSIKNTLMARGKGFKHSKQELFNTSHKAVKNNKGSYCYQGDWNMLDQLIISYGAYKEDIKLNYVKGSFFIYKQEWMLQNGAYGEKYKGYPYRTYAGNKYLGGYSDHLPVYIHLD